MTETMTTRTSPQDACVQILTRILDQITYHAEDRKVWAVAIGRSWMIKMQLHRADTPRVVGERGSHIKAIDALTTVIGAKSGVTIRSQLLEPEVGSTERYHKFKPAAAWNSAEVKKIAEAICEATFSAPAKIEIHDGDDFTSTLEVIVDRSENHMLVDTVCDAMKVLFNAIGKANGRILFVDKVVGS